MNKKLWKCFFRALIISMLAVFILGGASVSAAEKKTGFVTVKGKTYYIKKDGSKQKGWLELNGKKYYFNTKTGVQLKGWAKSSDGKLLRYFTSGSGYMVTGFLTDSKGHTRYFDPSTGLLTRGWMTDSKGYKYYFTSGSGVMAKGWMKNSKGDRRYFNSTTGRMRTGWVKNSKGQYRYFNTSNGIMNTGLKKVGGSYYYFSKSTGYRYQNGLLEVNGKTYYFSTKDGKAHTGWLEADGKKYYFNTSTGVRYENTTATIDGKTYKFDKNGAAELSDFVVSGNNIIIHDQKNNRDYKIWKTFLDHPGLASGELKDVDILAALCETEAGNQGHVGMVAVALCVLNRTIKPDKEFPSEVRHVVFQGGSFAQYSVVSNGRLIQRLNGQYEDRAAAYKAANAALKIFDDYVKNGTPRTLKGFDRKDFNFMYFMTEKSFWSMPNLNFSKVDKFLYKYNTNYVDEYHMFFVDWVTY